MLELALIEHIESIAPAADLTAGSPKPTRFRQSGTYAASPSFFKRLWQHDLSGKYWKKKLKCYVLFWMGIGAYASIADIFKIWIESGDDEGDEGGGGHPGRLLFMGTVG